MADKYLNYTVLQYFYNRLKTIFANKTELPTATSDLTNDSDFQTSTQVSSAINTAIGQLDIPTSTSELTNDSGFITNAVNDLVNYYKKSETYTQTEVDNLIGQISTVSFEIVQSLPQTGQSNIIYLLANSGTAPNVYDEYVWINNAWEKIGSTAIDLSNYWTSTSGESNSLIAITTAEIDTIFE